MDKACSTSSRPPARDDIDERTKPGYLPGASGIVVQAALDALATSDKDTRLTIEKRRSKEDGRFYVTVKNETLDDSK